MAEKSSLHSQKGPPLAVKEAREENPSLSTDETSLGHMLRLAAPMIVTHISYTVMQFVDRFMVSRLGTEALAAILPAGFAAFVPAGFAFGVMISVNTFVSQSLGRGEKENCSNYCWQAMYMGLVYSVVTLAILWPAAPAIFKMMGDDPVVAAKEVTYFRIMLYTQIAGVLSWSSTQFFMGIHKPIVTVYATLASQIVNVAANYVLIFGEFGFPRMRIAGAGWGTFIGTAVGVTILMAVFLGSRLNATFRSRRTMNIDLSKMRDLSKVGLPAGLELMLNVAFWGVILFWLVGEFGKEAMAATSAVLSSTHVSVMPVVGLATALTAAVGKSIGRDRKDTAIKQARVCLRIGLVYMGLIGICFFLFRNAIMRFWAPDDKIVVEMGADILILAAIYQVFHAARIIYGGSLRGAGDTVWLAIVSALGAVVILGLGGLLIVKLFPALGPIGPWIAATVSIIAVGLANRWRFKSNIWMRIDLFKHRPIGVPVEIGTTVE